MKLFHSIRRFALPNAALASFLFCYGATVVLGNLLYASPLGVFLLSSAGYPTAILQFPTTFSLGYWVLLLSPLVVVPVIAVVAERIFRRPVEALFRTCPGFSRMDFLILSLCIYGIIFAAFYRSGAVELFLGGVSAADAIEARFTMQARLSFLEMVSIHSIMPFLAYYSFVSFMWDNTRFWGIVSALSCAATLVVLVFLNMKWPVILFAIGIVASLLLFSKPRFFWIKLIGATAAVAAIYLIVSTVIFRLAPEPEAKPAPIEHADTDNTIPDLGLDFGRADPTLAAERAGSVATTAVRRAPFLIAHAINRMAVSFPYYYFIFTEKGPVCGTLYQQYLPGAKPCHPSYLVYKSLFVADGYEDRGTAPAAPHITAYAFGGWTGAALGLIGMGLVLAFFAAVPHSNGPMAGAWTVLGVVVGYHLSQVPGDEIIFYATGIIWPFLLILVYSAYRRLARTFRARPYKYESKTGLKS